MRHFIEARTIPVTGISATRGPVMNPKAKSPYQRYAKREYLYSASHREWQRSMGRKVKAEADRAAPQRETRH